MVSSHFSRPGWWGCSVVPFPSSQARCCMEGRKSGEQIKATPVFTSQGRMEQSPTEQLDPFFSCLISPPAKTVPAPDGRGENSAAAVIGSSSLGGGQASGESSQSERVVPLAVLKTCPHNDSAGTSEVVFPSSMTWHVFSPVMHVPRQVWLFSSPPPGHQILHRHKKQ